MSASGVTAASAPAAQSANASAHSTAPTSECRAVHRSIGLPARGQDRRGAVPRHDGDGPAVGRLGAVGRWLEVGVLENRAQYAAHLVLRERRAEAAPHAAAERDPRVRRRTLLAEEALRP